jgi:acetate kinase
MKILVLNSGSSSLKYKLFDGGEAVFGGVVERIGEPGGVPDHHAALRAAEEALARSGCLASLASLDAVGHRVVHGGERFVAPVLIDETVIEAIRALIPLAPLHNPANLEGIETVAAIAPALPQVAVFDTAFHQTMPESAYLYAIPYELYEREGIRRYGFHGTSHAYIAQEAARRLGKPLERCNLITLHLGNGASACAIRHGRSIDTSMGLTPLEGLVMGTRSGDLDPQIPLMLAQKGIDADTLLNRQSGLKGLCGDNDLRRVVARAEAGDAAALRALAVYVRRIRKYLGAYLLELGRIDALVFSAGVGEHSPKVRAMVCEGLEAFGIVVDPERNGRNAGDIAAEGLHTRVLVIPTDEERAIAEATERVLKDEKE